MTWKPIVNTEEIRDLCLLFDPAEDKIFIGNFDVGTSLNLSMTTEERYILSLLTGTLFLPSQIQIDSLNHSANIT